MQPDDAIYRDVVRALTHVPPTEREQVYALSFYICDEDDDPRRPILTVGYNTLRQWQQSVSKASSSAEAKWNFAFWLQNELVVFGASNTPSASLLKVWMQEEELYYTDDQADEDFDATLELGELITQRFVAMCCSVAKRLHDEGIVSSLFPAGVPIVVHELEYYETIARQTEGCNPAGVAAEFAGWVRGWGHEDA